MEARSNQYIDTYYDDEGTFIAALIAAIDKSPILIITDQSTTSKRIAEYIRDVYTDMFSPIKIIRSGYDLSISGGAFHVPAAADVVICVVSNITAEHHQALPITMPDPRPMWLHLDPRRTDYTTASLLNTSINVPGRTTIDPSILHVFVEAMDLDPIDPPINNAGLGILLQTTARTEQLFSALYIDSDNQTARYWIDISRKIGRAGPQHIAGGSRRDDQICTEHRDRLLIRCKSARDFIGHMICCRIGLNAAVRVPTRLLTPAISIPTHQLYEHVPNLAGRCAGVETIVLP